MTDTDYPSSYWCNTASCIGYLNSIQSIRIFDKLIWYAIDTNSCLFGAASSLFGPDGTVNYDYIVTNSINLFVNCLKMYSQRHTH